MLEKIYIARHGYRLSTGLSSNWKSETGLPRDPPLTVFGVTQAQEVADYFLSLPANERPTAIFSSPYYRCLQTSKPISNALAVPIFVEHGISEWYSPAAKGTGLHPRPGSASSLQAYFSEIDPSWSSLWYPSRKGESVKEVQDRIDGFLDVFVPELERQFPETHKRILLVSHAATVITLARALLGDNRLALRVGCCSLTEVSRKTNEVLGGWEPKKLADGAHLIEGSTRDWGFEDVEIEHGKLVEDPGIPGTEHDVDEPLGSRLMLSSRL